MLLKDVAFDDFESISIISGDASTFISFDETTREFTVDGPSLTLDFIGQHIIVAYIQTVRGDTIIASYSINVEGNVSAPEEEEVIEETPQEVFEFNPDRVKTSRRWQDIDFMYFEPPNGYLTLSKVTSVGTCYIESSHIFRDSAILSNMMVNDNYTSETNQTIFNVYIVPTIEFKWNVTSVTPNRVNLEVEFANPLEVSIDPPDVVQILVVQIIDKIAFESYHVSTYNDEHPILLQRHIPM